MRQGLWGKGWKGLRARSLIVGTLKRNVKGLKLKTFIIWGSFFTWNNKRDVDKRIWCKLDRAMVNEKWGLVFPSSYVMFFPPSVSDHCPMVLDCGLVFQGRKTSFKFCNFLTNHEKFIMLVERVWKMEV